MILGATEGKLLQKSLPPPQQPAKSYKNYSLCPQFY